MSDQMSREVEIAGQRLDPIVMLAGAGILGFGIYQYRGPLQAWWDSIWQPKPPLQLPKLAVQDLQAVAVPAPQGLPVAYIVSGLVVDQTTGAPVMGVRLYARKKNETNDIGFATSASDGLFSGNLPFGPGTTALVQTLLVEVQARHPPTHENSVWFDLALPVPAANGNGYALSLSGMQEAQTDGLLAYKVASADGKPVPGAEVALVRNDKAIYWGRTGPDGKAVFRFVVPGEYDVRARHDGHESNTLHLNLAPGKENVVSYPAIPSAKPLFSVV